MFPKVFDHETAANGCDPKDPNHGGFHKWVIPNGWMVYIIQHNVKMDDLRLPTPFEETANMSTSGYVSAKQQHVVRAMSSPSCSWFSYMGYTYWHYAHLHYFSLDEQLWKEFQITINRLKGSCFHKIDNSSFRAILMIVCYVVCCFLVYLSWNPGVSENWRNAHICQGLLSSTVLQPVCFPVVGRGTGQGGLGQRSQDIARWPLLTSA